ncbi:MAG: SagB/ThcOx family dehydrogenase, partial [Thermosynechococcaceae cyanobacterium]
LADLLEVDQNLPPTPTVLPSETDLDYPEILEGELLPYCHEASEIYALDAAYPKERPTPAIEDKYNFPFCLKVPTTSQPIMWGDDLSELAETIRNRRSTRQFTGAAISLADLSALLDFTYHPGHYQEQGLEPNPDTFDLSLIQTFVAVSDVMGLEAGCYYYAGQAEELRQIRFKNFRPELHYLCLQQDLGRDAAAVVFHTADLGVAIARYGDRAYRYLHMDAGYLGQRINLAAIRLNLGVSGIAGFFDDHVNEVLGIPIDEAVLYITTLGQPRRA